MIKIALTELLIGTTLTIVSSLNNTNTYNFFLYLSITWLVSKITRLIMGIKLSHGMLLNALPMLFNSYAAVSETLFQWCP